jgi:hypothetical protein
LDHDGNLDLLGHALYSHDVVALFGNGDASFRPAKTLATFDDALHSLEIADLNGDGQLDVVVSFNNQTQIAVLPGIEDRSLGPAQRFELGERVGVIRIADFDRDQKPDLLLITAPIPGRARLGIMPGLGGGNFGPLQVADTGYSFDLALSVTVVDLNHDGKLDLVTRTGAVFLDIAASKLKDPVFNPFGSQVVVGDLGADGELDLAEVDSDDNRITVFNGDGTGAFTRPAKFSAGSGPGALAIADFNADGRSDLAIMSNSSDSVSVRLSGTGPGNIGVGGFADPFTFSTPLEPRSVAVADFDGNGELDLVVSNAIPSGGDSLPDNGVSLVFGAGNGIFRSGPTFAAGTSPLQVAAADLNGDQRPSSAARCFSGSTNSGTYGQLASSAMPSARASKVASHSSFSGQGSWPRNVSRRLPDEASNNCRLPPWYATSASWPSAENCSAVAESAVTSRLAGG